MISDAVSPEMIDRAITLARQLQNAAGQLQTPAEARQQAELERMLQNPADKVTLMRMTDEAFRSKKPRRAVDQFTHILDVQGVPRFFSPIDRALLRGFQSFGAWLPGVAAPLARERMRHETANVILPGEEEMLTEHLRASKPRRVANERQFSRRSIARRSGRRSVGSSGTALRCNCRRSKSSR